eukprot:2253689-Amphidinium_carterae.3
MSYLVPCASTRQRFVDAAGCAWVEFGGSFSNISADEMFQGIDTARNGVITLEDFMAYWVHVRHSGYKDKDSSTCVCHPEIASWLQPARNL